MGEFFGSIYCWFEDVFGLELANYLWGNVSPDQQTNMYVPIGFTMLAVSLLVCCIIILLTILNWQNGGAG